MQPLGYNALVDVPAGPLATLRAQLTAAAGTVGHVGLADAFTRLAAAALPLDNRYLSSVRWAREWARCNAATYGALGTAAQAVLDQATGFPFLVPDDAGTVAHVRFNGTGILDSKGNVWTMNGAVPQVAGTEVAPPGAGPFSAGNYYSLGAGADPLDFAGDFFLVLVYSVLQDGPVATLLSNENFNVSGWAVEVDSGTSSVRLRTDALGAAVPLVGSFGIMPGICVTCAGRSSGTMMLRTNLTPFVSGAGATVADASVPAQIGQNLNLGRPATRIVVHEVRASSATPSAAAFEAVMNDIKSRLPVSW